jgi:hypothetical protein
MHRYLLRATGVRYQTTGLQHDHNNHRRPQHDDRGSLHRLESHVNNFDTDHSQSEVYAWMRLGMVGGKRMETDVERMRGRMSMFCANQGWRSRQLRGTYQLRRIATSTAATASDLHRYVLLGIDHQRMAFCRRRMFEHGRLFVSSPIFAAGRLLPTRRNLLSFHQ